MDGLNNPPWASVDASSTSSQVESYYAPLQVRIYDDGDDEDELSLAPSSASFDSVSEHMTALSDMDSIRGSFKEFFARSEALSATLNRALRKLNELNSGVASLDTSVLDNTSEEAFRFRLLEIAFANNLSLDDDVVHDILNNLLPVVRARFTQKSNTTWHLAHHPPGVPAANLRDDDDTHDVEKLDGADSDQAFDTDQSENTEFLPYSAQGLPIRVADDTMEEQELPKTLPPSPLLRLCDKIEKVLPTYEPGHGSAFCDAIHHQSTSDGGEQGEQECLPKGGEYSSVSCSANTDNHLGTRVYIQQPVVAKEGASQNMNAERFSQKIPESTISSAYAFNSGALSNQEDAFNNTSEMDPDEGIQDEAFKDQSVDSTATTSGMPIFDDVGFPARPPCWGHCISCIESGIIFSRQNNLTGVEDVREKLWMLRLKLLCLSIRLQQSRNDVVRQVLYRLDLADRLGGGSGWRESDLKNLRLLAEGLEARRLGRLEFECTVLILGKSGVGKSATINSLFGKYESETDAFKPATKEVKEIIGKVNGLTLRVIDTPGFLTSGVDNKNNLKILSSVKCHIKRSPPDVVLYVDRLDLQCRDYGELSLFRAVSAMLGNAIWNDTIVVFTHGLSAPLDDANNAAKEYEMFIARRLHTLQETICQAAGNMQLRNLHSVVENHAAVKIRAANCSIVSNREVWQPQLLLLCFASKILAEADNVLRFKDKTFWVRPQVPSLSFLLALLFQSQVRPKLHDEQAINEEDSNSDEEVFNSDDESEYEVLPFFRRLTRKELLSLDKEQREHYHEELKYRKKLLIKRWVMDARAKRKEVKKGLAALAKEVSDLMDLHHEKTNPAAEPVPMPDMALPLSFDSDNPTHRYHSLATKNGLLIRPVQSEHGWDRDIGHDGLSVKKAFLISPKLPVSISGQIIKDKNDTNVQLKCATSFNKKSLQTGLNIHTLRDDVAYEVHGEIKFNTSKKHKAACGLALTMIGETSAAGMKLEDCLVVNKWLKLAVGGGVMTSQQEVAYGGYLEASFKGEDLSSIGLSIINWKKSIAIDSICQVQFLLGQTMITGQANLNSIRAGQIRIRANSSDQFQMALIGLVPLLRVLIVNRIAGFLKSLK